MKPLSSLRSWHFGAVAASLGALMLHWSAPGGTEGRTRTAVHRDLPARAMEPLPHRPAADRSGTAAIPESQKDSPNSNAASGHARGPASFLRSPEVTEGVNSDAPGIRLTESGRTVTVEAFTPLHGQTGPALTIALTESNPDADPAADRISRHRPGFTYEDQIFRTKWGWAAHEAVRRAAREEMRSPAR